MWLHGLPLTPSVAQWFSCTAWTTVWKPVTLIISTALDYPEAETVWNPEAGVQLTPIESVISQDCQVGDALAAQDKRMLIQCSSSASLFDIWTAFPLCQPLLGWAGVELPVLFLVSNQSARKLRQQPKIEVTAQEWTNWNRLFWNLQAFADTCWSQHIMS